MLSGGLPGDPKAIFSSFQGSERFFFFFWLCHRACRILVPRPGINPPGPCSETKESKPLDCQGSPREVKDLNFPTVGS